MKLKRTVSGAGYSTVCTSTIVGSVMDVSPSVGAVPFVPAATLEMAAFGMPASASAAIS